MHGREAERAGDREGRRAGRDGESDRPVWLLHLHPLLLCVWESVVVQCGDKNRAWRRKSSAASMQPTPQRSSE